MKGWYKYENNVLKWGELLNNTQQNIIYNQEFWINLKVSEGWKVDRLCYKNEKDEIVLIFVIYVKKYAFFNYLWSSGGFSECKLDYLEDAIVDLKLYVKEKYKNFYFRMNSVDFFLAHKNYLYCKHYLQPKYYISSGFTVVNNLKFEVEDLLKRMNSKRRYTVKSALKKNITWEIANSTDTINKVQQVFKIFSTESQRNFKVPNDYEINYLSKFSDDFLFIVGIQDNNPITAAIINISNNQPLYLYAATTEEGRKIGASYAMICHLQTYLSSKGYKFFDLLGISPTEKDIAGIDKFKLTFSGDIKKYNGEWEFGSLFYRFLGNLIIKLRN